ncbi:polyprenyl synthetase family protein [Streptomyces sp. MJP52]|uniref:polyprenyl synthetase family protein n=1 Tax=Streptomyces sp. MJP52 TaxID=2940555 RepID=UPI0024760E66|nr:polyprenyl synthetase family protein [Streptomyces sp. MJP52]MDH6224064.1 geranylgeranyl pyrophosphate synthase [Streptomyces sp. MJP52]
MPSLTYQDLHARHADAIRAEVAAALGLAGPPGDLLRSSCEELMRRQTMRYPLSVLPLAVHGAETGDPEPALPLAVVHLLWWTAACRLDDLADAEAAGAGPAPSGHEAVLTTLAAGSLLPLRLLDSPRLPAPVRPVLTAEFTACGLAAVAGQLADLRGCTSDVPRREAVLAAYRGKSGAPFAMITAMASLLAGAEPERTLLWREFGDLLGILWQLFNDQEDITSGRHEDLRNGTVTHLLACAHEAASPADSARLHCLRAAARTSPQARAELLELLLSGPALEGFRQDLETYRSRSHGVLDRLSGRDPYASCLYDLIGQASRLSLRTPAPVL